MYHEEEQKLSYFQAAVHFNNLDPVIFFRTVVLILWCAGFPKCTHRTDPQARISRRDVGTSELFKAAEGTRTHCRLETTVPASPRDLIEIWSYTNKVGDYQLRRIQGFRRGAWVSVETGNGLKSP